jgi:hypothetical protein
VKYPCALFSALAIVACGCNSSFVPPDAAPQPFGDAAVPAWNDLDPCGSAVGKLGAFKLTPARSDFLARCRNGVANGLDFGTECVRTQSTQVELELCGITCTVGDGGPGGG